MLYTNWYNYIYIYIYIYIHYDFLKDIFNKLTIISKNKAIIYFCSCPKGKIKMNYLMVYKACLGSEGHPDKIESQRVVCLPSTWTITLWEASLKAKRSLDLLTDIEHLASTDLTAQ